MSKKTEETKDGELTVYVEFESEEVKRARWRCERFEELGFGEVSLSLTQADVNWHEAERLLAAGATHAQVLRLLWP